MTSRQLSRRNGAGFTILEILMVVAILGIIAAIAIPLYGNYTTRARATDIVTKYDAAKSTANANIAGDGIIGQCEEVLKRFAAPTIPDEYARIAYAFEAVSNGNDAGYRPVLTVCSRVANQGAQGVKVARAAHDEFAKNMSIEGGAVLTDTVVSFALPLTDPKRVVCRVPVGGPFTACGDPVAVPTLPVQNVPTQLPQAVPNPLPQSTPQPACSGGQQLGPDGKTCVCPAGKELVQLKTSSVCAAVCPPGMQRDLANNPLSCISPPASTSTTASSTTSVAPVTCGGGQQPGADGKSCVCPQGQQFDGAQCFTPAVCTGGQIRSQDQKSCACPQGQTMQGGQCRTPPPTGQQQLNTCLAGCASIHNPGHRHQCEKDCAGRHHP